MKRELIDSGTEKRFVRRDEKGRWREVVKVGRALAEARCKAAKAVIKPGEGGKESRKQ